MAEILGTFALAGELGRGMPQGHGMRLCIIAMRLAEELRLSSVERGDVFDVSLLVHGGCTAGSADLAAFVACDELAAQRDLCFCDPDNVAEVLGWMRKNVAPRAPLPERIGRILRMLAQGAQPMGDVERGCGDVGSRLARRLGLSPGVCDSLGAICERWSGKGPRRLAGAAIPIAVRVVHVAMAIEVFWAQDGRPRAQEVVRRRGGKSFDPEVARAFASLAKRESFWESLVQPELFATMVALEPSGPRRVEAARFDDVALAFADLVDLKSAHTAAHCRATAALAERLCRHLGLAAAETRLTYRSALTHDVGLIGVPTFLLQRAELTAAEEQQLRLHPYYSERLLAHIPSWGDIAAVAAAHHERQDGSGYPDGLAGDSLGRSARVLAIADAFDERTRGAPGRPAQEPEEALAALRSESGWDADCLAALAAVASTSATPPSAWPAGLTDREVEILRLVARGLSNKEIAAKLFVSPHTVRHHLEHAYEKAGVSSRAGATLFAMESGLLR